MQDVFKQLNLTAENLNASAGTLLASENPTTGKRLAQVQTLDESTYEQIIQQAQQAQLKWRLMPAPQRGEIVREIGLLLREKKPWLSQLISLEMGKILAEAEGEVQEMIDMSDFAVGQARMLYGKTIASERVQHRLTEQWHPLGVVGVITAFNFPMAVWSWNAFIAAITGNTVIWKPSSKTPLCALAVQNICNHVLARHALTGIFSLMITPDQALLNKLVADSRINLVSFTGSTKVGKNIAQQVAARFGRSLLECSGNNAIIIDETADLNLAIPAVVFGAVGTAGQRCTTTRRLMVHKSKFKLVTEKLVAAYRQIKIGDPLDTKNLMGPLIDSAAVNTYQTVMHEIQKMHGKILYGGHVLERDGYFVEPTIVVAQPNWPLLQQENFVPILYIMPYSDFETAIAWQNDVPQGLSSALFTNNLLHAEYFLSAAGSDCGIANINVGTSGAEIGGAFGGEKETGGGREAGSDAWKYYMRRQTNTINFGKALPLAQGIRFESGD